MLELDQTHVGADSRQQHTVELSSYSTWAGDAIELCTSTLQERLSDLGFNIGLPRVKRKSVGELIIAVVVGDLAKGEEAACGRAFADARLRRI